MLFFINIIFLLSYPCKSTSYDKSPCVNRNNDPQELTYFRQKARRRLALRYLRFFLITEMNKTLEMRDLNLRESQVYNLLILCWIHSLDLQDEL